MCTLLMETTSPKLPEPSIRLGVVYPPEEVPDCLKDPDEPDEDPLDCEEPEE
jgi:hypothetical protein